MAWDLKSVMSAVSHANWLPQEDIDPFIIGTTTRILNTQPGLQIPGAYGQMPAYFGNLANADYNALVASLTKRTGELRGFGQLFFTAAFTWAHNLDDADGFARNSSSVSYYNQNRSLFFGRHRYSHPLRFERRLDSCLSTSCGRAARSG